MSRKLAADRSRYRTSASAAEQLSLRESSCRSLVPNNEVCDCHTSPVARIIEANPHGSSPTFSNCRRYLTPLTALVFVAMGVEPLGIISL
jgi:hypothetical protein